MVGSNSTHKLNSLNATDVHAIQRLDVGLRRLGRTIGLAPRLRFWPRGHELAQLRDLGPKLIELRFSVDRAPRRCQRRGMVSESLGLTSHKSSCNCTGCGMLRAGVCINCAEKTAALLLESGSGEIAVEPCSGACREAIELYFSTPPERWRAPLM